MDVGSEPKLILLDNSTIMKLTEMSIEEHEPLILTQTRYYLR